MRVIIHSLGTIGAFCFIASLHTTSATFRSILRRCANYFNVFYFVLNAYVLWWSNDETELFDTPIWTIILRSHALICFLVSGGFALDIFTKVSCQIAFYLVGWNIFLDMLILYGRSQSETNFWILLDYIIDDLVMLCGYFYLYQFHAHQKKDSKRKTHWLLFVLWYILCAIFL